MDWEKKFKAIVEETDANLAKVKITLGKGGKASEWLPTKFSPITGHLKKPFLGDLPYSSHSIYGGTSSHQRPGKSPLSQLTQSLSLSDLYNTNMSRTVPLLSVDPIQDKLEEQNKAIEQLKRTVQRLESERDQYREHIRDLHIQVQQVSTRLSDSCLEQASDRRAENWRREIMTELDDIRSQMRSRQSQGHPEFTQSQMMQQSQELLDLRRFIRENTDSLRKDVDVLRNRIATIELSMSENGSQKATIYKTQIAPSATRLHRARDLQWYNSENSMGNLEMAELRTNMSCLKHKVDAMESLMRTSGRAGRRDRTYANDQIRYRTIPPSIDNLSDDGSLDLANYDLSEFSLDRKPKPRQDPLVYDIDEELDINDLDLSDDKTELSDDDVLTIDDM